MDSDRHSRLRRSAAPSWVTHASIKPLIDLARRGPAPYLPTRRKSMKHHRSTEGSRSRRAAQAGDVPRTRSKLKPALAWAVGGVLAVGVLPTSPASPAAAFSISEHETDDRRRPPARPDRCVRGHGRRAPPSGRLLCAEQRHPLRRLRVRLGTGDINDLYDQVIVDLDPAGGDPCKGTPPTTSASSPIPRRTSTPTPTGSSWVAPISIDSGIGPLDRAG